MIWMTWRQSRAQTLGAIVALAVIMLYLLYLGLAIRHFYNTEIVGCTGNDCAIARERFGDKYLTQVSLIGVLLIAVPAAIGVFWGAPLITRELETGTHRLAWNQSVTRNRWLAVKLAFIALFSLAVTGLLSLLLTWSASRLDQVEGKRFAGLNFDSRNIVPLGYAVFFFVLGVTIGLFIRRSLPAMALTLALFAGIQILMPLAIRSHLMTPITSSVAFTAEKAQEINGIGSTGGPAEGGSAPVSIMGYQVPDAWVLSTGPRALLTADGQAFTRDQLKTCMTGDFRKDMACLATKNLHFSVTYHPAGRYWKFQWIETALFVVLAAALVGFCFWRIPRIVS